MNRWLEGQKLVTFSLARSLFAVKIGVFYVIYYTLLTLYFLAMLWIFFQTLPEDKQGPKYKMDSSIIGTNPGMQKERSPCILIQAYKMSRLSSLPKPRRTGPPLYSPVGRKKATIVAISRDHQRDKGLLCSRSERMINQKLYERRRSQNPVYKMPL